MFTTASNASQMALAAIEEQQSKQSSRKHTDVSREERKGRIATGRDGSTDPFECHTPKSLKKPPANPSTPTQSCLKKISAPKLDEWSTCLESTLLEAASITKRKRVYFDEVTIREYPVILGDHPAVSSGAPVTICWDPMNESLVDLDFYEYCRGPERRTSRRRLLLSVRKRANMLMSAGYTLEEIARATIQVEKMKKQRAATLKNAAGGIPGIGVMTWDILSGAVETTGSALKRVDVLGVGPATASVVGVTGKAMEKSLRASITGVNTVGRVSADLTLSTGKFLKSGVNNGSRVVADGVVKAGRTVAEPVVGAGKVVTKATGRAFSVMITPITAVTNPNANKRTSMKSEKKLRRKSTGDAFTELSLEFDTTLTGVVEKPKTIELQ